MSLFYRNLKLIGISTVLVSIGNLVYELTKRAGEAGFLPVLYTNANYPASNACYQKIGYRLRGRLCTVSLK